MTCIATDASGNSSTGSFPVTVKGASEQLADLAVAVLGVGPGTSLVDKVDLARTRVGSGKTAPACGVLGALAEEVRGQLGKSVAPDLASALFVSVPRIANVVGCTR